MKLYEHFMDIRITQKDFNTIYEFIDTDGDPQHHQNRKCCR